MSDETSGDKDAGKSTKSATAFRTISEVAKELDLPQHVLRFWETKFPQVRPMKRGGGRRYYRPDDMHLLKRIRDLLYVDGYTIKGVQKLLRQSGSVKNFVNETEAPLPLGEGALAGTNPIDAPALSEQPTASSEPRTDNDAFRREVRDVISDLKGLREQLIQSAS